MSRPQQQRIAACLALAQRRWVSFSFTPTGDATMADQAKHQTLMAAGVPQDHAATLAALGVTPDVLRSNGITEANAGKIDWAKWIALIQQIAAIVIPLIPK